MPQSHQGRMWMTSTWTQPLETVSHVQTQMRHLYKLPTRNTRRGYGLPADWGKAVSGLRLNWKGSATFARKCGDMTIRVLGQSGIALLWKTATPLRCKKWWSGLTNCLSEATGSTIYTRGSKTEAHGRTKTLVLLLKQYCTHYYWFYERGMTRAMVGLQGLHSSDAFWCSIVSASVGLKSFCPWCFKLGGNTEKPLIWGK